MYPLRSVPKDNPPARGAQMPAAEARQRADNVRVAAGVSGGQGSLEAYWAARGKGRERPDYRRAPVDSSARQDACQARQS